MGAKFILTDKVFLISGISLVFFVLTHFFKSLITFSYGDNTANAKSVLSVLGACVKCGDEIVFTCEGEDEDEALEKLVEVVESGLGE